MTNTLKIDAKAFPRLFHWNGRLDDATISAWAQRHKWTVPPDLADLWSTTGGGEIFETERILAPGVNAADADSVEAVTAALRRRGMPDDLVVFHQGFITSVFTLDGVAYVTLDSDCRPTAEFSSLEDWYVRVIRAEYGERYGLGKANVDGYELPK